MCFLDIAAPRHCGAKLVHLGVSGRPGKPLQLARGPSRAKEFLDFSNCFLIVIGFLISWFWFRCCSCWSGSLPIMKLLLRFSRAVLLPAPSPTRAGEELADEGRRWPSRGGCGRGRSSRRPCLRVSCKCVRWANRASLLSEYYFSLLVLTPHRST